MSKYLKITYCEFDEYQEQIFLTVNYHDDDGGSYPQYATVDINISATIGADGYTQHEKMSWLGNEQLTLSNEMISFLNSTSDAKIVEISAYPVGSTTPNQTADVSNIASDSINLTYTPKSITGVEPFLYIGNISWNKNGEISFEYESNDNISGNLYEIVSKAYLLANNINGDEIVFNLSQGLKNGHHTFEIDKKFLRQLVNDGEAAGISALNCSLCVVPKESCQIYMEGQVISYIYGSGTIPKTTTWAIEPEFNIFVTKNGEQKQISTTYVYPEKTKKKVIGIYIWSTTEQKWKEVQ